MNFIARAFQRNRGPRPSVSVTTVDGRTITSGNNNDRIDIRAGAINRGGYAEATGLNNSTVATAAGHDSVRIHAHARGRSTNAWAMRNSTLDVGPGHDKVDLRAVTRAGAFDPAYGMDNSSFSSGQGRDKLRINAIARGNTTDTIAAYGALNSQINTGADNDKVHIRASASNRRGYAEAIGLDHSVLETETGDDVVRIHARACGNSTNAWAMRNSTLDAGAGHDSIDLRAVTRAGAFDPAYGMDNSSFSSGQGRDKLRINAIARGNTTDTIAAYGALNSQINTGADNDKVHIRASASNRRGYAEAIGLDHSVLETETGDDVVRIHAHARGQKTNAWAMRNSTLDVGPGHDSVEIRGNALNSTVRTGEGFDSVRITGLETEQLLVDTGAQDDELTVDGGTGITYISGAGSDKLRLTRNYFTSLLQAKESEGTTVQELNTPVAEAGPKAETNQVKPDLAANTTSVDQEPELNSLHSSEASDPQTNPGDPLLFVDFITGENGDSIDCDDILIGHGIGLNRQSIFEDGFLSFAQEGNDSTLYFDSDGFNQQDNDKVALVIFKDVQAADFSQHNLNSRIINNNDFLLSQENQRNLNTNPATETCLKSEELNHVGINPSIAGLETNPILMSSSLQPAKDQLNPFATNQAIPGTETNSMLHATDLQPSIQLI